MTDDAPPVTLIGHPFATTGMGAQLRSHIAAMDAVPLPLRVLDLFGDASRPDYAIARLLAGREVRVPPPGVRIFHVNGDEVPAALAAFARAGGRFEDGRNVIVPAWELPRYPAAWAGDVARFDEVWAISRFVADGLAGAGIASHLIGQAVEPAPGPLLPRRWFGIRESAFVLVSFLDTTSYAVRKNPEAAIALLAGLHAARPWADMQLVIKVKHGDAAADGWGADLPPDRDRLLLTDVLDDRATTSLLAAADCFVSLHRAEGFGRGLGEAMALGRLALGTGWSGSLDVMDAATSLRVPYRLVDVPPDAYPHAGGQHWAEPDVAAAVEALLPFVDDPARVRPFGAAARASALASHGNRAVGLRVLARLKALAP